MKFSEAWLREWVDPDLDTQGLGDRLTMAGLETEAIEPVAGDFSAVIVAAIDAVEPHPDADKLRVCQVSIGSGEPLQIVCGAPNVRVGMRAPLATVGARLPGGLNIKKSKLRGVPSLGMLCSARELGLSEDHQGLMSLPVDAPLGCDLRDYLELNDAVIDVALTPNRGDCLSIEGMAREVAAITGAPLKQPEPVCANISVDDALTVDLHEPQACPRYLGRVIRGIDSRAPTPLWMQEKLRRAGIRSLGAVIDVTNFVLLELGQPMHAFDLQRIENGIEVRLAHGGERLSLLDGRSVELDDQTLVIADRERALALAGIMGGSDSSVTPNTSSLFLEVAYFSPEHIAGRARRYGLATESSHRFERGVDPGLQHRAMERATALLLDLVGGEAGPVVEAVSADDLPAHAPIALRRARIERVLGFVPEDRDIDSMLLRLGMRVQSDDAGWVVVPPSWRFDITMETDLVEEVGRVFGYERLPTVLPHGELTMRPVPEAEVSIDRIRTLLIDRDYQEVITYSFVEPSMQQIIVPSASAVSLRNPISSEMSVMRASLWPGLINTARYNLARQQQRIRIFENGLRFISQAKEIKQENSLSGLLVGDRLSEQWGETPQAVDFYDLKADVEAVFAACGREAEFRETSNPALHPGQAAEILVQDQRVGLIGCIHPGLASQFEIPSKTFLFELELDALLKGRVPRFEKLSRFPHIRRDLAIVVDAAIASGDLCAEIRASAGPLLRDLRVFDLYRGKGIESGLKSIAFGLILQDSSRTLTDEDVETVVQAVSARLKSEFGATLRE